MNQKRIQYYCKKPRYQRTSKYVYSRVIKYLSRYDSRRKVKSTRRILLKIKLEKIAKIQNISKNELKKAKKLQNKSIDELREIARLRRIKNSDNLKKEDLLLAF